jgi:hypothetical protein
VTARLLGPDDEPQNASARTVTVSDRWGRRWLLPFAPNPTLTPDGHTASPTELRALEHLAGPLTVHAANAVGSGAPAAGSCCDLHNQHCEPPAELRCWRCSEAGHDTFPTPHADGSPCLLTNQTNPEEMT